MIKRNTHRFQGIHAETVKKYCRKQTLAFSAMALRRKLFCASPSCHINYCVLGEDAFSPMYAIQYFHILDRDTYMCIYLPSASMRETSILLTLLYNALSQNNFQCRISSTLEMSSHHVWKRIIKFKSSSITTESNLISHFSTVRLFHQETPSDDSPRNYI